MRTCLLILIAAAASMAGQTARAAPVYVAVEGGVLFARGNSFDIDVDFSPSFPAADLDDAVRARYRTGFDGDAVAGLDLGRVRIEAELGIKRAALRDSRMSVGTVTVHASQHGTPKVPNLAETRFDGRARALSAMINGLVDVDIGRHRLFAGAGLGGARLSLGGDKDGAFAYQLIGGATRRLSERVEAGIKYRYFRTARLDLDTDADLRTAAVRYTSNDRFRSHSVLLSLAYHFGHSAGTRY